MADVWALGRLAVAQSIGSWSVFSRRFLGWASNETDLDSYPIRGLAS
jgi:hypothetical protein